MTTLRELREAFKRHIFFPRTKMDYWTFRKLRALKSKDVGDKGWSEWFKYLTRDVNLSPTLHERVQEGTQLSLLQDWMMNFADNSPNIRYGDDAKIVIPEGYHQSTIADIIERTPILEVDSDFNSKESPIEEQKGMKVKFAPKGSAVVVGRGPSMFKHKHLEMLADAIDDGSYKGIVICSDGGFIPTLEAGIIPEAVITVDGAPIIKKYFDHPLVKEHGHKIKWITSVTINHEVYQTGKKAGLKVYWFNPMFDDWRQNESWTRLQRLLSRTPLFMRGVPAANAGGNSGACAWIMASDLFKRSPVALIGLDMGYPEGTPLEQTQYYSSMMEQAKGDVRIIEKAYPKFYHPVFKQWAFVDLVFYHYRLAFIEMQEENTFWYKLYGGTINCTEGGTLWGNGITCMPFKQFLEEHPK